MTQQSVTALRGRVGSVLRHRAGPRRGRAERREHRPARRSTSSGRAGGVGAAEPGRRPARARRWCCWSTGCAASTPGSGSRRPTARCTPGSPPRTRPAWSAATCAAAAPRWPTPGSCAGFFTPSVDAGDLVAANARYPVHRVAGDRSGAAHRGRSSRSCARSRSRSRRSPGPRPRRCPPRTPARTTCSCSTDR